jgi:hypothetical protein
VREFHTNALLLIALLTPIANRLEAQRHGTLAVISSLAGDRGRPSNYLYGSAKAHCRRFSKERPQQRQARDHRCGDEAGFDIDDMHAHLEKPRAQTLADRQADATADVAHLGCPEDVVGAEFHAPEDRGRDEAHRHVEREYGRVVARILRLEAEDLFLVEHVFHDEADAGADEYR